MKSQNQLFSTNFSPVLKHENCWQLHLVTFHIFFPSNNSIFVTFFHSYPKFIYSKSRVVCKCTQNRRGTVFRLHNTFSNARFNFIRLMETKFHDTPHIRQNIPCTRINLIGIRFHKRAYLSNRSRGKTDEVFPNLKRTKNLFSRQRKYWS